MKFLEGSTDEAPVDEEAFDRACGVGTSDSDRASFHSLIWIARRRDLTSGSTTPVEVVRRLPPITARELDELGTVTWWDQEQRFGSQVSSVPTLL